jgi:hypothetical protein
MLAELQLRMVRIASLPNYAPPMTSIEAKIAVFYGKVDDWTGAPDVDDPFNGPITGPFETKADAIERGGGGCIDV